MKYLFSDVKQWQFIMSGDANLAKPGYINEIRENALRYDGALTLNRDKNVFIIEFDDKQSILAFVLETGYKGVTERSEIYDKVLEYRKKNRLI